MRRLGLVVITAAIAAAGCTPPEPKTPAPGGPPSAAASELEPITAHTTLIYTRPRLFESVNRPTGFGLIRDYRAADSSLETLPGAWNDAAGTLTADVNVTLESENLVYVDDPAVTPGAETPIRAGRSGELHEITCPESVPPEHACYLLQVLR